MWSLQRSESVGTENRALPMLPSLRPQIANSWEHIPLFQGARRVLVQGLNPKPHTLSLDFGVHVQLLAEAIGFRPCFFMPKPEDRGFKGSGALHLPTGPFLRSPTS